MRKYLSFVVLAIVPLAQPASSQRIRGAFVVPHALPTDSDLAQVRASGLNLLILQYAQGTEGDIEIDSVRQFIQRAERAGIDYMIGLRYHEAPTSENISELVRSNLDVLQQLSGETMPRFRGWYVPLEVDNDSATDYAALASAFKAFQNATPAPLALSIYFNPYTPKYLPPEEFARRVEPVLAPFDVVLMQDGVGVRSITEEEYPTVLEPYYVALKRVVMSGGRRFWATVEAFVCSRPAAERQCNKIKRRAAAPADRIQAQVEIACRLAEDVVAYDLMEYLTPRGHGTRKRAYDAYVSALAGPECRHGP